MAFQKRSFVGKGKLYLGRFGSNNLQRIGNTSKLSLSIDEETKELADYENPGGGIADALSRIKDAKITLTLHNLNAANLALALYGDSDAIAAGTVTAEVHTAHLGALIRLAKLGASAVVVTNEAGTTTYAADTDYQVSGAGLVILESGTIPDGSAIKVNYAYGAQHIIEAISSTGLEFTLAFDGMNEADSGKPCVVDLWRVRFTPVKSLDLIDDDFAKLELEGKLLKDETRPTGTSQYFRYAFV
ncbi:hypothetical protein [Chitinibacter sp. GC72]|uniref:phage tail tube protein n=1 Tax=Chitinibacter sp. GC72 TaxID=1526917 RepID=UPI0012F90CAF|nr:hypothetical protein [Chitinibacter sp. GC72]